jgi:release factor glutamine methyltransferase
MQSHREAIQAAVNQGLDRLDAQLLLLHVLGRAGQDRAWLWAHDQEALTAQQAAQFQGLMRRRLDHEPMAYIAGHQEFFGLDLLTDARALVPRADTETLVDWALTLESLTGSVDSIRVLDLGTGSGAIALALKHARPHWQLCASDASEAALSLAQQNGQRLQLQIEWRLGEWLSPWCSAVQQQDASAEQGDQSRQVRQVHQQGKQSSNMQMQQFDCIVSNPPYIAEGDAHLGALQHEPQSALTSGMDGLKDIRQIAEQSLNALKPGGWLLLEHGYDQAAAVRALLQSLGYQQVQSRRDLAGIERCTGGRLV